MISYIREYDHRGVPNPISLLRSQKPYPLGHAALKLYTFFSDFFCSLKTLYLEIKVRGLRIDLEFLEENLKIHPQIVALFLPNQFTCNV